MANVFLTPKVNFQLVKVSYVYVNNKFTSKVPLLIHLVKRYWNLLKKQPISEFSLVDETTMFAIQAQYKKYGPRPRYSFYRPIINQLEYRILPTPLPPSVQLSSIKIQRFQQRLFIGNDKNRTISVQSVSSPGQWV